MSTPFGRNAQYYHIFLLGLAIKLGGCVAAWHNGYTLGVWGYFIACMVVAVGYSSLNLCVAELTSIIAFPGGHFGYVRASLGPFWGYMAGIMGLIESVFFLAVSLLKLGQAVTIALGTSSDFEFLWWAIAYFLMMCFHIRGGLTLWRFMSIATVITMVTLFIYLIGSIPFMNFPRFAYRNSETGFASDGLEFFSMLRLPCWLFVGIDLLPLTSEEVVNATQSIPKAVLSVMGVMLLLCIWLQMCVAGQEPGLDASFFDLDNVFPLSNGFAHIFAISRRFGTVFSIAPCFLSCTGFMFVAGRQFNALARSGLLPKVLSTTYGADQTPLAGMLAATVIGLVVLPLAWMSDPYTLLFRVAISGGCVVYILVLCCFIQFRLAFINMARQFRNPFGIVSAVVGILCFALIEISVLFILPLRANFYHTYAFFGTIVLAIVHYATVVVHTQTFSPEEQENFMRNYIINANIKKKQTLKERSRAQKNRVFAAAMSDRVSDTSSIPGSIPPDVEADLHRESDRGENSGLFNASWRSASIHDSVGMHAPPRSPSHAGAAHAISAPLAQAGLPIPSILVSPPGPEEELGGTAGEQGVEGEEGIKKRSRDI